ncbi:MAG TPA: HEPN domain-containing protein [Calidithermus sp.]|nr:HEPN domain-containing protein [Calidithermus sp.]
MRLVDRYAGLLERVSAEVQAHYGSRLVALAVFGSVARGTPREDSDVDLLVVAGDLPDGVPARLEEFRAVERRLDEARRGVARDGRPTFLSPVLKTPAEVEVGSPLFHDLVEDAKILYDPRGFLTGYLARLRQDLARRGARRRPWGGGWYWDLGGPPGESEKLGMTRETLAESYLRKARSRLKALDTLRAEADHSDVVREAQELVELALKAMLRAVGVDPPKYHDVGPLLLEHRDRFAPDVAPQLARAADISGELRTHRELAMEGDVDFIPTERYSAEQAARAYEDAAWVLRLAERVVGGRPAR